MGQTRVRPSPRSKGQRFTLLLALQKSLRKQAEPGLLEGLLRHLVNPLDSSRCLNCSHDHSAVWSSTSASQPQEQKAARWL